MGVLPGLGVAVRQRKYYLLEVAETNGSGSTCNHLVAMNLSMQENIASIKLIALQSVLFTKVLQKNLGEQ